VIVGIRPDVAFAIVQLGMSLDIHSALISKKVSSTWRASRPVGERGSTARGVRRSADSYSR
jgi:hypothetical protein